MKKFGETFKKIRKDRKMTLKQVGDGILPVPTLHDFEKGKLDIKLTKFYALIKNLNITFEEFWYIVNEYELDEFQQIWDTASKLCMNQKVNELRILLAQVELKRETKAICSELEFLSLKNLVAMFDADYKLSKTEKQKISEYLMSVKSWTRYELVLYRDTLKSLDVDTIEMLSNDAFSRGYLFKAISENRKLIAQILIDTVGQMLSYNRIESAIEFQQRAKDLLSDDGYF